MAFPQTHNYLVVHGTQSNGGQLDTWQFGLRIGFTGTSGELVDDAAHEANMTDALNDVDTWWTAIDNVMPQSTQCLGVKLNAIAPDGTYANTTSYAKNFTGAPRVGLGDASLQLPAQLALAVTLHTAATRGLASKGRIYLPALTTAAMSDGMVHPAIRTILVNATAQLLRDLNDWPGIDINGTPGTVLVASSVGPGAMREVTGISIGTRFDVQRRRANKIREVRSIVDL
jgi:hypothetical protein